MRRLFTALLILFLAAAPALADVREAVNQLGKVKLDGLEDVIKALAAEPGEVPARALGALAEGNLYVHKADGLVVIAEEAGDTLKLIDPVTAEALGDAKKSDLTKIRINNSLRRVIRAAAGGSALTSPDAAKRLEAAQAVFKSRDAAALPALEEALTKETDPNVKAALELAKASALLASDAPDNVKSATIATLAATGSRDVLPILAATAEGTGSAALDAQRAISDVERTLAYWSAAQNVWFGISLGSVLLLAAIGLAITFGVMGVIIERIMIRPLYGRPLETLLAT